MPRKVPQVGDTALTRAVRTVHHGIIAPLIHAGADVNAKGNDGLAPLSFAVADGFGNVAKQLIEAGANVNARDRFEATALMWAARFGQASEVVSLLEHGADVDATDHQGRSAHNLAELNGHTATVTYLAGYRRAQIEAESLSQSLPMPRDPMSRPAEDMSPFLPAPTPARSVRRRL